ncbi:MAG: VCBS repeat-containing protein [Acidobacteria bacterium]|nr:VCBS repeat-containing protein [Acidobacteriota bacterium]
MRLICALLLAAVSIAAVSPKRRPARFREKTIATGLQLGYQLVAVDLNGDRLPDLIAIDERGSELAWYENPTWRRHTIVANVPRTINVDYSDIDDDGVPELAILYKFESKPSASIGVIALLHHDGDPRNPWKLTEIDRVPSAHRVRFADLDGHGRRTLLMAPMVGLASTPPAYEAPVPIYVYQPDQWKRRLASDELSGVVHGLYPTDWDGDGRQELLTASFAGQRLFRPSPDGAWPSTAIAQGAPEPCPKCGSSEVAMGHLGKQRFLAAIEPWHGHEVSVYRETPAGWIRKVIDDSFVNGHALAVGDVDGDGMDEIVAGYRGAGYHLYLYDALDKRGEMWDRRALDDKIAAVDCKIRDFTGDGRPDIACIGASTGDIRLYENLGK